jgi:hypothetical protein
MGLFSKLFGNTKQSLQKNSEHAVIVHFQYFQTNGKVDLQPLRELEDKLEKAITSAGAGVYDGNEIAINGRDGCLYMYGSDGDKLFRTVKPILMLTNFTRNALVIIRYGPPQINAKVTEIKLDSNN